MAKFSSTVSIICIRLAIIKVFRKLAKLLFDNKKFSLSGKIPNQSSIREIMFIARYAKGEVYNSYFGANLKDLSHLKAIY